MTNDTSSVTTSSPSDSDEWEWVIECSYEPVHTHSFPRDWTFGGANGLDPRTDPRFMADTYIYYDDKLNLLHITSAPLCDEQAIDEFTKVASWGPTFNPRWLQVRRFGERSPITLPVEYFKDEDAVYDKEE